MTQANHLLRALGIICDVNDYHAVLEWRNITGTNRSHVSVIFEQRNMRCGTFR